MTACVVHESEAEFFVRSVFGAALRRNFEHNLRKLGHRAIARSTHHHGPLVLHHLMKTVFNEALVRRIGHDWVRNNIIVSVYLGASSGFSNGVIVYKATSITLETGRPDGALLVMAIAPQKCDDENLANLRAGPSSSNVLGWTVTFEGRNYYTRNS